MTNTLNARRHVLRFNLLNQSQEAELLISDEPSVDRKLRLTVFSQSDDSIGFPAGATLSLRFRSGIFADLTQVVVTCPDGWSWDASKQQLVSAGFELPPKGSIEFEVDRLALSSEVQQHSTRVELKYDGLEAAGNDVSGVALVHMTIVHHLGRRTLPLRVSVVGSRAVLNDGRTSNEFTLRLTNTSPNTRLDLQGGKLIFSMEASASAQAEWALGTVTQVAAINCTLPDGTEATKRTSGDTAHWDAALSDSIPPNGFIDFQFRDIVTQYPSGLTPLHISYEDIPGYWEGELQLMLEKVPLLFLQGKIGQGIPDRNAWAKNPTNKHWDGRGIFFGRDPGGGSNDEAWIRHYARSGEACTLEIGVSNDSDDHIALMPSGNVGVGTNAPQLKLDVKGSIGAGNSDLYFTKTDHAHSGYGNKTGFAAIENASNYGALMILGRSGTTKGRMVKLWDFLEVHGGLDVTGAASVKGRLTVSGGATVKGNITLDPSTKIKVPYKSFFTDHNRTFLEFETDYHDNARGRAHFYAPTNYYKNVPALTLAGNYGAGGSVGINKIAPETTLHVGGNIKADGSISPGSDVNTKEGIVPVEPGVVLSKVLSVPISKWSYKAEQGVMHIGPMAQDFHAAFGLGADDKHISVLDADGVALAAIQGLYERFEQKSAEVEELRKQVAGLRELCGGGEGG